jgi:hypothetical protein
MKMRMARTLAELFIVEEERKWGKLRVERGAAA